MVLLGLEPERASVPSGENVLATMNCRTPSGPCRRQRKSPLERLAAGPYGPDVVGLRLGMTMQDAEAASRREVGRVPETPAPSPGQERPPAWLHGRLFIAADGKEKIAVFEGQGQAAGRVVGVWRRMLVPRTDRIEQQVVEAMTRKYGSPATQGSETAWNAQPSTDYHCRGGQSAVWETWMEDGKPVQAGTAVYNEVPALQTKYAEQGGTPLGYDQCGPLLRAKIGNGGSGLAPGVTEMPVAVSLLDMAWRGWARSQAPSRRRPRPR